MTGYTPADLAAALAAGIPTILAYVGAGVGAALALFVAFLGIRAAFRFFRDLTNLRKDGSSGGGGWSAEDEAQWQADVARADALR